MELSSKFERREKYKEHFLPTVSALAAAHTIVCFDQPENPFEIIFVSGYPLALGASYLIALAVFYSINLISWRLDKSYPWERSKWKRLWMQLLMGVFGAMAIEVAGAAIYFFSRGHHISETVFFDKYFFMILGYIVTINMYYNAEAIVYWKALGRKPDTQPDSGRSISDLERPQLVERDNHIPKADLQEIELVPKEDDLKPALKAALLKYLSLHDVVLIYTENDDVFAKTSSGEIITWNFRLGTTMKGLDPKSYFKTSRFHIVKRIAIERIHPEPLKNLLTIYMKEPCNDMISVPKNNIEDFTSWWYVEGE